MSSLEIYCQRVRETKGIYHMQALKVLRDYIKAIPEKYIIEAISRIENPILFRALLEAGVNRRVQEAIASRGEKLL